MTTPISEPLSAQNAVARLLTISLDSDDWSAKDFYGADWRWRRSHLPNTPDVRGWRRASVPGSIYYDLWRNGEIPDPYIDMNSRLVEWVPARTWLFKRTFNVDAAYQGRRMMLRFEGIDYEAEFFLNGVSLGSHRGMFTPAEFDITDALNFGGENLLAVVIERAPDEQPQIGYTSRVRTHKSRMSYWWDFCPRMIQLGIWGSVALHISGPVRVRDVFVQPRLNADLTHATVDITTELEAPSAVEITLEYRLSHADTLIGTQTSRQTVNDHSTLHTAFELDQPTLWWPNGYGDPALYTLHVRVVEVGNGRESDTFPVTFGIRRVELAPNEGAPADALPYTLVVNGQKVYINGWNWVPQDVMYGRPQPEKLEQLLTLAQRAHVTLLRVWGGGLIETEAFYAGCDRLGILVWQEFILSSSGIDNLPPDDPAYIAQIISEAEQIVPRKRNHPALAIWSGGNELQSAEETPIDMSNPFVSALRSALQRLDPDRVFLPTSPSGPVFSFSLENYDRDPARLHDVHGPWEYGGLTRHYTLYNRVRGLLHSEFGAEGLTNLSTLEHTLAEATRWPVTLDNPVWMHRAAWWVKEPSWRAALGDVPDLAALVKGTQLLQAEGVRYAIEAHRRDMYHNSGALPWQFDEPYPMAACTSAVDYYTRPKPLYYAVARAYEPLNVSAQFAGLSWKDHAYFEAELWATNATQTAYQNATVEARLIDSRGHIVASQSTSVSVPANGAQQLGTFRASLAELADDAVFLVDLSLNTGDSVVRNQYVFTRAETLAPLFALPPTSLDVRSDADGLTISNTGAHVALYVWIEDARALSAAGSVYIGTDNYVCVLPGESRHLTLGWHDVPAAERVLRVGAWNSERLLVRSTT